MTEPISVHLLACGPGDPQLLTLGARRVLDEAARVIALDGVDRRILATIPATATVLDGAKLSVPEIANQCASAAQSHQTIALLAPGDGFVIGAFSDIVQALEAAGIAYQAAAGVGLAAGITSAAGIPLTHRGDSFGVIQVPLTGTAEDDRVDWLRLTDPCTTVVLQGALAQADHPLRRLLESGLNKRTPVAGFDAAGALLETTTAAALAEASWPPAAPRPWALAVIGRVVGLQPLLATAVAAPRT